MRKANSKAELRAVNQAFDAEIRQRRYGNNGVKPRPQMSKLPTPQQLATLAATLARNLETPPTKLCSFAMELWATADEYMQLQKRCNEDWKLRQAKIEAEQIKLPEPKKYPMSWEEFIRLVLPKAKGRTDEQALIYKTWLHSSMMTSRYLNAHDAVASTGSGGTEYIPTSKPITDFAPTQDEVNKVFARDRQTPIDSVTYRRLAFPFLKWYRKWRAEETSRKRAEAAKLRHKN